MPSTHLDNLTLGIVGLGLIGASIACGLKKRHPSLRIVASDCNPEVMAQAQALGFIDAASSRASALCQQCDLIVLAVPVLSTQSVLAELAPALLQNPTALTDVGSVKGIVAQAAQAVFGEMPSWFIPGHPIAGS
jgi:3-phosphoshikimate 1-carboxyvinyltransferase